MKNAIIFGGTGGQGILSMGTMLASCAVDNGKNASYLPMYSGEKRGGSAKCIVVIDDKPVLSPMVQRAGTFVAMDMQGFKFIDELEENGILFYDSCRIKADAIGRGDAKSYAVPAADLALEIGSPKAANIVMIGAIIGITNIVNADDFRVKLDHQFRRSSDKVKKLNSLAFDKGLEYAKMLE